MTELIYSPLFGILLSLAAYLISHWIYSKVRHTLANPLLLSMVMITSVLLIFDIPLEAYEEGSSLVSFFIVPYTTVLSLTVYRHRDVLKANLFPIIIGTLAGTLASVFSILTFGKLFHLDHETFSSILGLFVTTPVAISFAERYGGIAALTIASTLTSGLLGNILSPMLAKIAYIKNPISLGIAIGSCSHGLGTAKALELGEVQGALSGIAVSFTAFWSVLVIPLFFT